MLMQGTLYQDHFIFSTSEETHLLALALPSPASVPNLPAASFSCFGYGVWRVYWREKIIYSIFICFLKIIILDFT